MLDWTGERFLPWTKEPVLAYEHLHRYLWASTLVKGKKVLDLASGEGYGANTLALHASYVCAVDNDAKAVRHASERYIRPNLKFLQGNVTNVPVSEAASFDVIVCFEAIEHIEEHDKLILEVARLLKPDGLFIVSTPNKEIYRSDSKEEPNAFHVKELTFEEFNALLASHFSNVRYFGQRVHPASALWSLEKPADASVEEFTIARGSAEFEIVSNDRRIPEYFVALASNVNDMAVRGSILVDCSDEYFRELDRVEETIRGDLKQRDEALQWRASQVEDLEKDKKQLLGELQAELERTRGELKEIRESGAWKFTLKLCALRDKFGWLVFWKPRHSP
jgi:ubiquinone/menaquinone biosynthesis C-methylase UbiE